MPGEGRAAILTHGDLPDAALPAEKVIAELFGGRFHGFSMPRAAK